MGSEIITPADAVELERILIEAGAELAAVARSATAAILDVVAVTSPAEVDIEWDAEAA